MTDPVHVPFSIIVRAMKSQIICLKHLIFITDYMRVAGSTVVQGGTAWDTLLRVKNHMGKWGPFFWTTPAARIRGEACGAALERLTLEIWAIMKPGEVDPLFDLQEMMQVGPIILNPYNPAREMVYFPESQNWADDVKF